MAELNGIVSAPVDGTARLSPPWPSGPVQGQPGERLGAHDHRPPVEQQLKCGDRTTAVQLGELAAMLPAG